jgi:membrane associated rhomboid family serine protease
MQTPPPITRALLIAITLLLFVTQVPSLKAALWAWLGLMPVRSGFFWPWQVLTYPLVHADAMQWFVNSLVLYMFGSQLEGLWGARRYVQFLVASVLSSAVVYLALTLLFAASLPQLGAGCLVWGMMLAFAILFPHQRILLFFVADVTMRNALLIFLGIEVFLMLGSIASASTSWVQSVSDIGGAIGAYLMILWWRHRPPSFRRRPPIRRVH